MYQNLMFLVGGSAGSFDWLKSQIDSSQRRLCAERLNWRHKQQRYKFCGREPGNTVPEISRFLGIIVAMYYNHHSPPHFHAIYGESEALIRIEDGDVIGGWLPPRILGLVWMWYRLHRRELGEDWDFARLRRTLNRIDPLE